MVAPAPCANFRKPGWWCIHVGARHMAEPAAGHGVTAVYGEEYVARRLWRHPANPGRIHHRSRRRHPTPARQSRTSTCLSICRGMPVITSALSTRQPVPFTGDTFGLSYRELDVDGRQFIFPTTSPSQFEPQEMRRSIERLLSFKPSAMYLTHYGQVPEVERQAAELLRHRLSVSLARTHQQAGSERHQRIHRDSAPTCWPKSAGTAARCPMPKCLNSGPPISELNAQGLGVWLISSWPELLATPRFCFQSRAIRLIAQLAATMPNTDVTHTAEPKPAQFSSAVPRRKCQNACRPWPDSAKVRWNTPPPRQTCPLPGKAWSRRNEARTLASNGFCVVWLRSARRICVGPVALPYLATTTGSAAGGNAQSSPPSPAPDRWHRSPHRNPESIIQTDCRG